MSRQSKIILVALFILLTLPLTSLGYGSHMDPWLVADAAARMWRTGTYQVSRATGFPLFEITVTPFVHYGGWYLSNLYCLAYGLLFVFALFRLADRGKLRHPRLLAVSLAFLPIIVKNASSTLDHLPSLAVLMWAYVFLLDGKTTLAAILVGVGAGFRPTGGLLIVPAMIYLYKDTRSLGTPLKMGIIATVVGVLGYLPALAKYGIRNPFPLWIGVVWQIIIGGYYFLQTLGIPQTAFLIGVLAVLLWRTRKDEPEFFNSPFFAFHATNILIWFILFWPLPFKPEYLLPMIPSVVLLIDRLAGRRLFLATAVVLLSYHFVTLDLLGGESGMRTIKPSLRAGYTFLDIEARRFNLSTRHVATESRLAEPTVLMYGVEWIPMANDRWVYDEHFDMYRQREGNLALSMKVLEEPILKALKASGYRLVVWNGSKWEYVRTGNSFWRQYVDVVDRLEDLFGVPIEGRPLQ